VPLDCDWRVGPDPLSVTLLDGERFLYGRSRKHPVVVRLERWIGAGGRVDARSESPVDAEEMDIGNRKAADGPLTVTELSVCDREGIGDVLRLYRQTGIRAVQSTPLVSRAGRVRAEYTLHAKLLPWLTLDLDAAYTQARFLEDDPAAPGRRIPGAIEGVVSTGLSLDNLWGGWFGGAKIRYFGPPAADRRQQRALEGLLSRIRPSRLQVRGWPNRAR
jgi:hypothetical protein